MATQSYITTSNFVTDRQNTDVDPMINAAIFQVKRPIDEQLSVGTTTIQNGNVVLFNVTEIHSRSSRNDSISRERYREITII